MSRAGRKRKAMERREANGDVQRMTRAETAETIMRVAMMAPHRLVDMPNGKPSDPRDPRLENELGRMLIRGEIDARQYAAGRRWAGIVARMRQAIDAPSDRARGLLGVMVGGAQGSAREMTADEANEARAAYADADHALGCSLGGSAIRYQRILKATIVQDQTCANAPALRLGLNVLARHFEIE